jgi:hypothetical protein
MNSKNNDLAIRLISTTYRSISSKRIMIWNSKPCYDPCEADPIKKMSKLVEFFSRKKVQLDTTYHENVRQANVQGFTLDYIRHANFMTNSGITSRNLVHAYTKV